MAQADFTTELERLGFVVTSLGEGRVAFPYEIPVGRLAGTTIQLGFEVPGDFPATPPGGPHVSPHLLEFNSRQEPHPKGGIHESKLGSAWQYWSRPYTGWNNADRTVKVYLAHIRHLFELL